MKRLYLVLISLLLLAYHQNFCMEENTHKDGHRLVKELNRKNLVVQCAQCKLNILFACQAFKHQCPPLRLSKNPEKTPTTLLYSGAATISQPGTDHLTSKPHPTRSTLREVPSQMGCIHCYNFFSPDEFKNHLCEQ